MLVHWIYAFSHINLCFSMLSLAENSSSSVVVASVEFRKCGQSKSVEKNLIDFNCWPFHFFFSTDQVVKIPFWNSIYFMVQIIEWIRHTDIGMFNLKRMKIENYEGTKNKWHVVIIFVTRSAVWIIKSKLSTNKINIDHIFGVLVYHIELILLHWTNITIWNYIHICSAIDCCLLCVCVVTVYGQLDYNHLHSIAIM